MRNTPAPQLQPMLAKMYVKGEANLKKLTAAGALANAVTFGGCDYVGFHTAMAMLPALSMSGLLASGRQPLPPASAGFVPHTALVHAEGSTPDVQDLLHELSARTATGYLFGGLSSARNRTLHIADGVFSGGLSGVLFGPEVELVSRVTQGCEPIGPVRTVTRGEQNLVFALDGKRVTVGRLKRERLVAKADGLAVQLLLDRDLGHDDERGPVLRVHDQRRFQRIVRFN